MKAVFWNKTVLGFLPVQELALRQKAERTGCGAEGYSLYEWCFYCFCGFDFKYKWWRHILTDCRHQHFLITNATITIVDLFLKVKTNIPERD